MTSYPKRDFAIECPTIMETKLTGHLGTAKFERRGHRYVVRFVNLRTPQCQRDGQPNTATCEFRLSDRDQLVIALHFTNYQPLWPNDNLAKGSKWASPDPTGGISR